MNKATDPLNLPKGFFRAAFDNVEAIIVITDASDEIVYVNRAFIKSTGFSADEAVGQSAGFIKSGETPQSVYEDMWAIIQAGKTWHGELKNRRKDGSLTHENVVISPIFGQGGEITHYVAVKNDLTRVKEMEEMLRLNETNMGAILDNIGARIYIKDRDFRYLYVNQEVSDSLGMLSSEIIGATVEELFEPDIAKTFIEHDNKVLEGGETVAAIEKVDSVLVEDERYFWSIKVPLTDLEGNIYALAGISTDITEQKKMEDNLRKLATTDGLTGIFNRRHFLELTEKEARRAHRYRNNLGFLMLDIDYFKKVNDTFGHAVGDLAIQAFARVGVETLRDADLFGRYGGEEFVATLPETPTEGVEILAERIRKAVADIRIETDDGKIVQFTTSIGATMLGDGGEDVEKALSRADEALYEAKEGGRNKVIFH